MSYEYQVRNERFEIQRCGHGLLLSENDGENLDNFCWLIVIFCGSYSAEICWRQLYYYIVGPYKPGLLLVVANICYYRTFVFD